MTCGLSLLILGFYASAQGNGALVSVKSAKIYSKPDTKSSVLRTATKGVKLTVIETRDNWCLVEVNNKQGWIEKKNITIADEGVTETKSTKEPEPVVEEEAPVVTQPETHPNYRQGSDLKPYMSGIRVGGNFANIGGSDAATKFPGYGMRTGFAAGFIFLYNFTEMFAFQPELLYSQKGTKKDANLVKFDYAELPLLLKVTIPVEGSIKPFATVGPYLAYCFNHASTIDGVKYKYNDVKPLDYGLSLGAGVGFDLTGTMFLVDLRYTMGLTTIHDNSSPLDLKNNVIFVSLGLVF